MVSKVSVIALFWLAFPICAFSLTLDNSLSSSRRFESANRASNTGSSEPLNLSASTGDESGSSFKKRKGRAFGRSILIPGWGQLTEGRKSIGYAFLTTEAILISSFIGLRFYGSWLEDDYRNYANQHAGIEGSHGHLFYVDIGNWMDRRSYNEQRILDRQFDDMYNSPADEWNWDSDGHRRRFKSIRISSDQARQNSVMVIGAIVLNHLVSAIEASRGVSESPNISLRMESIDRIGLQVRF